MAGLPAADLLVRRVRGEAARVPDGRGDDAGQAPERLLGAPEAAESEGRGPGAVGPRARERRARHEVTVRDAHRVGAAAEGLVGRGHGRGATEEEHGDTLPTGCVAGVTVAADHFNPSASDRVTIDGPTLRVTCPAGSVEAIATRGRCLLRRPGGSIAQGTGPIAPDTHEEGRRVRSRIPRCGGDSHAVPPQAAAATGGGALTGCILRNGDIVNVAVGFDPASGCPDGADRVTWNVRGRKARKVRRASPEDRARRERRARRARKANRSDRRRRIQGPQGESRPEGREGRSRPEGREGRTRSDRRRRTPGREGRGRPEGREGRTRSQGREGRAGSSPDSVASRDCKVSKAIRDRPASQARRERRAPRASTDHAEKPVRKESRDPRASRVPKVSRDRAASSVPRVSRAHAVWPVLQGEQGERGQPGPARPRRFRG